MVVVLDEFLLQICLGIDSWKAPAKEAADAGVLELFPLLGREPCVPYVSVLGRVPHNVVAF